MPKIVAIDLEKMTKPQPAFTHIIPEGEQDAMDYINATVKQKHETYFTEYIAGIYSPPTAKSWGHATDIIVQHLSKRLDANINEAINGMKKHRKSGAFNLIFAGFLMKRSEYSEGAIDTFNDRFESGDLKAMCDRIARKYTAYNIKIIGGPLLGSGSDEASYWTHAAVIVIDPKV